MKIRTLLFSLFVLFYTCSFSQNSSLSTDQISVTGQVQVSKIFTLKDILKFPAVPVKDVVIYNHAGEIRDTLSGMKGVLLTTVLSSVKYQYNKPRELNEFYFVLKATDGYRIILSWNEMYNSALGSAFFLITEVKGQPITQLKQRIAFLSSADMKTGRRYVKNLQEIEVRKLEP